MKYLKIFVVIATVIALAAFAYVFVTDRRASDPTLPQFEIETEELEVSTSADVEALKAGVTAKDEKDGDLTDRIIVENVSKFIEPNVAVVTYAVCDNDNHVVKAKRRVRYTDHVQPHFTLARSLVYSLSSRIDLKGVIGAKDDVDGDIGSKVIITTDESDKSAVGAYNITMQVTNSKGETATLTLPLFIENLTDTSPKLELKEYLKYVKVGAQVVPEDFIIGGEDLSISIDTNLDTSKAGVYQVHYYVSDYNNRAGHAVLNVVVEES